MCTSYLPPANLLERVQGRQAGATGTTLSMTGVECTRDHGRDTVSFSPPARSETRNRKVVLALLFVRTHNTEYGRHGQVTKG